MFFTEPIVLWLSLLSDFSDALIFVSTVHRHHRLSPLPFDSVIKCTHLPLALDLSLLFLRADDHGTPDTVQSALACRIQRPA